MEKKFDLEEALEQIKAGAKIDGENGVLAPLIKHPLFKWECRFEC